MNPEPLDGELRKRLRVRLANRKLFATSGICTVRLGTGRQQPADREDDSERDRVLPSHWGCPRRL